MRRTQAARNDSWTRRALVRVAVSLDCGFCSRRGSGRHPTCGIGFGTFFLVAALAPACAHSGSSDVLSVDGVADAASASDGGETSIDTGASFDGHSTDTGGEPALDAVATMDAVDVDDAGETSIDERETSVDASESSVDTGGADTSGSDATSSDSMPAEVVAYVDASVTVAQFVAIAGDTTLDAIEMAAGLYHGGAAGWRAADLPDRAARPLTIRPAPGATVTFDAASDGNYGDRAFGLQNASHITFDGTPGAFVFQHYLLAQDGVFLLVGASFITVRHVTFHNIAANAVSNAQSSHLFYVSRGTHDVAFDDITASSLQASDEQGASYGLNGLQVYTGGTGAAVFNVTARNWTISDADWATVFRDGTMGVVLDGWTITNCGYGVPAVVDFGTDNTGVASNMSTTLSVATPVVWGAMTDGGGNVWN